MKRVLFFLMICGLLSGSALRAAPPSEPPARGERGPEGEGKRPPPPPDRERPPGEAGFGGPGRRPTPGFGGGRSPMGGDHHEGFSQLSEEQKKRVRKAMDQAWGRPEVKEARDRVMRANDDLRRTLSKVLLEIDPDLQPLLEKLRPSRSRDGRGSMGPLPDPKAPDFAKQTVRRLESELMTFTPMERREGARELHARILGLPRVKEVFAQLEQAPMEQRVEAAEKFRAAYREVLGEEIRRLRGEAGGKGGPPGAGGETGIRRAPPSGEEGKKREAP